MNAIIEFLAGRQNVVDLGGGVILSKELSTSSELWHISVDGEEKKSFWVSNKQKQPKKGNYTGGRASYVMVMQKAVESFMRDEKAKGDKLLQLGILNALCGCVEFKTGKLVNRKTKQVMQRKDIMKVTGIGKSKLDRILQDMKSNGIITRTNDGYFVSRDFIKKGAK